MLRVLQQETVDSHRWRNLTVSSNLLPKQLLQQFNLGDPSRSRQMRLTRMSSRVLKECCRLDLLRLLVHIIHVQERLRRKSQPNLKELIITKREGTTTGGLYSTRDNHQSLGSLPSSRYRINKSTNITRATTPRKQEHSSYDNRRDRLSGLAAGNPQSEYTTRQVGTRLFEPTSSSKSRANPNLSAIRREFASMKKEHRFNMRPRLKQIEILQEETTNRNMRQSATNFTDDRKINTEATTPLQASLVNVSPLFSDAPRGQVTRSVTQLSQTHGGVSSFIERNFKPSVDIPARRRVLATKINFTKTAQNVFYEAEGSCAMHPTTPIHEKEESEGLSMTVKNESQSPTFLPSKKVVVIARTTRTNRLASIDDRLFQHQEASGSKEQRSPLLKSPTRSVSLAALQKPQQRPIGGESGHYYLPGPGDPESPTEKNSWYESPKAKKHVKPYVSKFEALSKGAQSETKPSLEREGATKPSIKVKKASELIALRSEGVSPIKKSKMRSAIFPALAKQPNSSSVVLKVAV